MKFLLLLLLTLFSILCLSQEVVENKQLGNTNQYPTSNKITIRDKNILCWEEVFKNMNIACDEMNSHDKAVFSYRVMLCYLQDHNRPLPICKANDYIKCCSMLSLDMMPLYETFNHQIESVCYYQKTKVYI
ncbi:hypothetical protein WA158_001685 [Blastocystis sp. Blastoise]